MKFKLATALLVTILVGCGSDDEDSGLVSSSEFDGTWKTECIQQDGGYSSIDVVTIAGSDQSYRADIYDDANCTDILWALKGDFVIGYFGEKVLPSGETVTKVKLIEEGSTYQAHYREDLVNQYNDASYCGYSDWVVGEFKETSRCSFDEDDSGSGKGVYYMDGNELQHGDHDYPLDNDGFPTVLSSKTYYKQ